jgi:Initiator Replication protein
VNRTLAQRTNSAGFPKAGELIEITGAHALEASDRAALNILYQFAFESGRMGERDAVWQIPISALSFSPNRKRNDCVRDSLRRLMRVVVEVPYLSADGEARILETHLFDFFDLSANETSLRATVRFGLPKELQPVLVQSSRWGRIKAEVCCSMTSKYAIALYELVQLRINMDRCTETFPIARFRDLLGVAPGAYERGNDFAKRVTDPAVLEVNGLSDMGVQVALERRSPRAPIEAVTVSWWRKQADEFRAAVRERNRSKLGRMARLRGEVEKLSAPFNCRL